MNKDLMEAAMRDAEKHLEELKKVVVQDSETVMSPVPAPTQFPVEGLILEDMFGSKDDPKARRMNALDAIGYWLDSLQMDLDLLYRTIHPEEFKEV